MHVTTLYLPCELTLGTDGAGIAVVAAEPLTEFAATFQVDDPAGVLDVELTPAEEL